MPLTGCPPLLTSPSLWLSLSLLCEMLGMLLAAHTIDGSGGNKGRPRRVYGASGGLIYCDPL